MALGISVRDSANVARTITAMVVRDGGNVQRTITEMWVRDTNNVSRLVFNPSGSASLAVVASPGIVSGSTLGTGTITTDAATGVGSGGTAPYTYAWTLISYSSSTTPTANSPSAAVTTFTQTGVDPGAVEQASWTCTVTDAASNTAVSDSISSIFVDLS